MLKCRRWTLDGGHWKNPISPVILNSIQDPSSMTLKLQSYKILDSSSRHGGQALAGMTSDFALIPTSNVYRLPSNIPVVNWSTTCAQFLRNSCITILAANLRTFCSNVVQGLLHTLFNVFQSVNTGLSILSTGPITTTRCKIKGVIIL